MPAPDPYSHRTGAAALATLCQHGCYSESMNYPHLAFCPYLPMSAPVAFGDWELGPANMFEGRWAVPEFKHQAEAFLGKFVDGARESLKSPTLLCPRGRQIDGVLPPREEIEALQAAITFAFLDQNPRLTPASRNDSWRVLTTDNTELFFWPVDVEGGHVTVTSGLMVRTLGGGYRLSDAELIISPPLDLHLPLGGSVPDVGALEAVHAVVLRSMHSPGHDPAADRLHAAIGWLAKAWRNTATVHFPERLVFLKTGFEAITGTSNSRESARCLRKLFEALPRTTPKDSEQLIWSPAERPLHPNPRKASDPLTDLERWFMAFADARNSIVHEGAFPDLNWQNGDSAWNGHLVFTAEFLLRAAIKATLSTLGFPDLWRSPLSRAIRTAYGKFAGPRDDKHE